MSMYDKRMAWQSPKSWRQVVSGQRVRVRWPREALPSEEHKKLEEMPWREGVITVGDRNFRIDGSDVTMPLPPLKAFEIWMEVR